MAGGRTRRIVSVDRGVADRGQCKLCLAGGCVGAGRNKHKEFVHCPSCGLVFVPHEYWISLEDERARYDQHDNTEANQGYVRFLTEVADVVGTICHRGARVLDFGCGENAVLTRLLRGRGFDCVAYDPIYSLGEAALAARYDVIVVCEVIEHLRDLRKEIISLGKCLSRGGCTLIRTQAYPQVAEVPSWWYARDATHLNFFAERTLEFAAGLCGSRCLRTNEPDIFVWAS